MANLESSAQSGVDDVAGSPQALALWFALPGLFQGIGLYWLTKWSDTPDQLALSLAMFLFVFGAAYFLTTKQDDRIRPLIFAAILGGLTGGLTWLAQSMFGSKDVHGDLIPVSLFSCSLICYIAVPFYRTVFERKLSPFNYKSLFEFGWNLPVIAATAALFTGAFWAVLGVWAALFDLIGIDFFGDIFFESWFAMPATFAAGAVAIGIIREREGIILALRGILFSLLKVLAPIFAVATILFSVAALATGLDELWSGFSATTLMITAVTFAVIFINAVLGDEGMPDNPVMRWTVRLQAFVMPILAGFAAYGLILRIGEYGLTHERFFAVLIVGVAAAYSVAYFITSLLPNGYNVLRQLNIVLAGAIFALAVLVQTPVLDAYKIAANAQLARLVDGKIEAKDIDLGYLKYRAGKAGEAALAQIRNDETLPNRDAIEIELARLDESKSKYDYDNARRAEGGNDEGLALLETLMEQGKLSVYHTTREELPDWLISELSQRPYNLRRCKQDDAICLISEISGFNAADPQFLYLASNSVYYAEIHVYGPPEIALDDDTITSPSTKRRLMRLEHSRDFNFNQGSDAENQKTRQKLIDAIIAAKPTAKPISVLSLQLGETVFTPGLDENMRGFITPIEAPSPPAPIDDVPEPEPEPEPQP